MSIQVRGKKRGRESAVAFHRERFRPEEKGKGQGVSFPGERSSGLGLFTKDEESSFCPVHEEKCKKGETRD